MNINRDVVYIISLILIIVNIVILNKKQFPKYTGTSVFNLVFLLCSIIVLHKNIYIGFFVLLTYLNINRLV